MRFSRILNTPKMRLVLLAPAKCYVPQAFREARSDHERHERLLQEMQQLRGSVYLKDGAVEHWHLTKDGRHRSSEDHDSWHLLAIDEAGHIIGCSRYLHCENTISYSELGLQYTLTAETADWERQLQVGVESELCTARLRDLAYVKVGGWALNETIRNTAEGLSIALATWGLAQLLGGCLGIATVTRRHSSSTILRKLGGSSLEINGVPLPPYYDPQYKCEMEIIRFDSRVPNPRYREWVNRISMSLLSTPVICGNAQPDRWNDFGATIAIANRGDYVPVLVGG